MTIRALLRRIFTWVTVLSMVPIAVAVLGSGYVTYRYNIALNQTRELVRHSLEVTTSIDDVMLDLQDLETGQRGYLITGEADYLAPFEAARGRFDDDLATLLSLVGDNRAQQDGAERIATLARVKLDELDETIRVRREDGFDAARSIVASDAGKQTMDRIRAEVDAMRARERDLLSANTDRMRRTENRVILIVAITIALSLLGRLAALIVPIWWRSRPKYRGGDGAA